MKGTGAAGQLFRLAFPLGIGGQGVFVEHGFESVRISGSGELPAARRGGSVVDRDKLGGLGRATLRTLTALDESGRPKHGPAVYVTAVSQVVPGWVFVLLAATLLLPVLVTSVDVFARARRRHIEVGVWMRWLAAFVAPFLAALAAAEKVRAAGGEIVGLVGVLDREEGAAENLARAGISFIPLLRRADVIPT